MARPFVNWSRTVRSQPRRWARPTSEGAVVELVRATRARGGRLKVAGAGHSWSPIAAGDDTQATLDELDRFVHVDAASGRVTVEGGVRLWQLNEVLARHGLAMPILGSIDQQTIAGVTATGTHGSSLHVGNVSQAMVGARLVTGTGEVLEVGEGDPQLDAVRVHLGALGVVTQVTLQTVPAFRLEERVVRMPFAEACATVVDRVRAHAFAKLWWLPHTDEAVLFAYDRTTEPGDRSEFLWQLDGWVNRVVFPPVLALGGLVPALVPTVNRLVDRVHLGERVRRGRSDHLFLLVMPPRHRETELAFPAEHAGEALAAVRDYLVRTRSRLDFIVEVRFVKGDASWMSPAHGRDTCQLGVYAARSPETDRAFAFWQAFGEEWGARWHWGKEMTADADALRAVYPGYDAFRGLARELDPDRVFRNAFLDRVLGPT